MENNAQYIVWYLLIGGIVGWLTGLIMRGRGFGIVGDVIVGVVGGLFGGWIAGVAGLSTAAQGSPASFVMALVGAVALVSFTRFFKLAA